MKLLIQGGMVYRSHGFVKEVILTENGLIRKIGGGIADADTRGAALLDASDQWIVPGFFDIHTHGAAGVDVNAATAEDLERICRFFASQGTTGWLASILTDTREQTLWCISQYKKWRKLEHRGAILEGIHLEGPFLAKEYKGAMPEHLLREADMNLLKEYQEAAAGAIRYITVSPEVEGIVDCIPEIRKLGIQVAIGHSGADYETSRRAIEQGAMAATHAGNAMKLLHQHSPAIFGAVLEDEDVYAEMICDGLHLHPGTVRFLMKIKGLGRVVAITDSIMAAGLPDGDYKLGVNDVAVKGGDAKLISNGVRAGSTLTTGRAYQNLLQFTGRSPEEILPILTENPARLMGMYGRIGSIAERKQANLLFLDRENEIVRTMVGGSLCYERQ